MPLSFFLAFALEKQMYKKVRRFLSHGWDKCSPTWERRVPAIPELVGFMMFPGPVLSGGGLEFGL